MSNKNDNVAAALAAAKAKKEADKAKKVEPSENKVMSQVGVTVFPDGTVSDVHPISSNTLPEDVKVDGHFSEATPADPVAAELDLGDHTVVVDVVGEDDGAPILSNASSEAVERHLINTNQADNTDKDGPVLTDTVKLDAAEKPAKADKSDKAAKATRDAQLLDGARPRSFPAGDVIKGLPPRRHNAPTFKG